MRRMGLCNRLRPEKAEEYKALHAAAWPGVLATINRVLADHGVNVEGQLLRTRDDLGYVITDIVPAYSDEVLDQLRAMDVTIRLRTIESE